MRKFIPGIVSYLSLSCGIMAILLAFKGNLELSGALVLTAYILDAVDGELARRLNATSSFGLQLDSLVDIVVFGIAAPLLVFLHLKDSYIPWWATGICVLAFSMAGVFRLARFNLSAGKDKPRQTTGLTISTSGAFLALSVLVDITFQISPIPDWLFLSILFFLGILMVSRIRFPELKTVLSYRIHSLVLLCTAIVAAIWLTPQLVWYMITTAYISVGLGRAVYGLWK
jgi:CDP-diacylglycerol--serine O-phosphatidyltransferase